MLLYEVIVEALRISSRNIYRYRIKLENFKPGWKDYVKEPHVAAGIVCETWAKAGKSGHGPLFEIKKGTNAKV